MPELQSNTFFQLQFSARTASPLLNCFNPFPGFLHRLVLRPGAPVGQLAHRDQANRNRRELEARYFKI